MLFCVYLTFLTNSVCEFHLYCLWVQILFPYCVPLSEYTMIYSLSVLEGLLDSFQYLAIILLVFMNILEHAFWKYKCTVILLYAHGVIIRVIMNCLIFSFVNTKSFYKVTILIYKTTNSCNFTTETPVAPYRYASDILA